MSRSASAANAPERRPPARSSSPKLSMRCGRWISSSTPPPTGAQSRSCPSSMNTPASASAGLSSAPSPPTPWRPRLDRIAWARGTTPAVVRLDNGPEMIANATAAWAGTQVGLLFIPPGEPWNNGYIESFNSRLRDECLNIHLFWSLAHARVVISDWKEEYNLDRPHSSLGYLTPAAYAAACNH